MGKKSWPVAAATSLFAFVVTLPFLLMPSLAAIVATDQRIKQITEDQLANQSAGCEGLEEIVGQLLELQKIDNPNLYTEVAPVFTALSELAAKDSELSGVTRLLRARIDPGFLQERISGTTSLKLLLNSDAVQYAVYEVEVFCDR